MNVLDWILAAIVALLAVRCFIRGFVAEVLSVAAFIGGLLAALLLYRPAGALVRERFGVTTAPEVLAFVGVFLIAFVLVKILEHLVREGLEAANLERADRVLGLVLGAAEGLIVASIVLIIISIQPLFDAKKLLDGSVFARNILPIVGPEVTKALGPALSDPKKLPKIPELPKVKKP